MKTENKKSCFMPDSNVLIALLCSWHENNIKTTSELNSRFSSNEKMILAAPTLLETYSVITRLPSGNRLSPEVATKLIEENFSNFDIIYFNPENLTKWFYKHSTNNISGGQIYDAQIAWCANNAKIDSFLTYKTKHFKSLIDKKILIGFE